MATMTHHRSGEEIAARDERDAFHVLAAQSDPRAFAPLYETYFSAVYGYCLRMLRDSQAASDATSETFMKALRALPKYRARSFRGWLFTIAHHVVIDMIRRRKPTVELDAATELATHEATPEERYLSRESDLRVAQLLTRLTGNQRQIMELRMAGLTSQEIAGVIGCTIGTVRTAQFRALARLRQLLGETSSQPEREASNGAL